MRHAVLALAAAAAALLALRPAAALPPAAPVASLEWSPGTPSPGYDVTFTINASDADGPVTGGRLDFGDHNDGSFFAQHNALRDASTCATGDQQSWRLAHRYAQKGSYTLRLSVTSGSCPGLGLLVSDRTEVTYTITVG
jgi:hypothetical protein